jgi:hypothetical protein
MRQVSSGRRVLFTAHATRNFAMLGAALRHLDFSFCHKSNLAKGCQRRIDGYQCAEWAWTRK